MVINLLNMARMITTKNIKGSNSGATLHAYHKSGTPLSTGAGNPKTPPLIDTTGKLIYVGEAKDLRKRLKQKYPSIPNWTHYRFDALPKSVTTEIRVSIERMVIRSYASLLKNKSNVDSFEISNYRLVNDKIDK